LIMQQDPTHPEFYRGSLKKFNSLSIFWELQPKYPDQNSLDGIATLTKSLLMNLANHHHNSKDMLQNQIYITSDIPQKNFSRKDFATNFTYVCNPMLAFILVMLLQWTEESSSNINPNKL